MSALSRLAVTVATTLSLATVACARPAASPAAAVHPLDPMKTQDRGRVILASQPSLEDLRGLRARGVTDVVNLRSDEEMHDEVPFDERAAAKELGLGYTQLPIDWEEHPYRQEVVASFARVLESSKGKVLLHCASGGRAGLVWAAYEVVHDGKTPDEAMRSLVLGSVWPMPLEKLVGAPLRIERAESPAVPHP